MREKLQKLMHDQGLTSSKLAELLEVQPSGISHLMAGRNKPGFDLLQRILRRFPQINPDWLLLDSDQMYRDEYKPHSPDASTPSLTESISARQPDPAQYPAEQQTQDLFSRAVSTANSARTNQIPNIEDGTPTMSPQTEQINRNARAVQPSGSNRIERIVIFYTDHTFESFDAQTNRVETGQREMK